MGTQENICGLCLKICDNYKTIGDMKDILDIVLPKIDLTVIQELMICTDCTEMLKKCFDFKATCVYTYDYIVPFVNKEKVKLDLRDVYLSINENSTGVPEDQNICGFCASPVKSCLAISIDVEKGKFILKKMIEQCLPELDLSIIEKPVICAPCHGSLGDCFGFVSNCLIVEERIKKYCETLALERKDEIELSSFLHFAMSNVTREVDYNSANIVKVENILCSEDKSELNGGNHVDVEDQKFLVEEEIGIKTDEQDFDRFEDDILRREKCSGLNLEKDQSNLSIKPTLTKEQFSKIIMYNCDTCPFQSKFKSSLKMHMKRHKDPSEVTMFKCACCSFQTKYKHNLKSHMLKHEHPSEVTVYNCENCSYQARNKGLLKRHLLEHKDPSEVTKYMCNSCSYETMNERYLNAHLLMHKDPSEITMYNCDTCFFQTKFKGNLKMHMMLHKDPSEVTMYRCDYCSFETKFKYYFKRHMLKHEDISEVTVYNCDTCSYQAKAKRLLKNHLLKHKDPSEVTMYKCNSCSFQTKYKKCLSAHLLLHKNSELTMYNCITCSYQTKFQKYLKRHLLKHKDPSEVTMYTCNPCSFQI